MPDDKKPNNLRIWDKVCDVDPKYTKPINDGRGLTAIVPMSLIKQATKLWGPMGEGWGFEIERETDRTEFALEFFHRLRQQAGEGSSPLGLHILMGEDFPTKAANMVRNVEEGRCAPWEIVCRRREICEEDISTQVGI